MIELEITRNPVFARCWKSHKRYVVMMGGAGSGKSYDTALFYVIRLIKEQGRNLLCIRKTDVANRNSTFNELIKVIRQLKLENRFTHSISPMKITCHNGNQVLFAGVADENQREKLKSITTTSGQITDVWIEEATELSQGDFEIIDDRLRGILPGGLFYQIRLTFNPISAGHWLKKVFFDRADENTLICKSTYKDNFFCDKAYYERMERRKEIDPDGYQIYGLGEWGETSGVIFSNYVIEDFKEEFDQVSFGQDFGFNHATALLKVGIKDNDIYVFDELYVTEKTTDEVINMAQWWSKDVVMYCDSAEPDRIMMWVRAGFRAVGVKKYPGSVKYSIDWLKQRTIHVSPKCVGLIKELSQYRWKKNRNGEQTDEPIPFNDDAIAALRYACSPWIPLKSVAKRAEPAKKTEFLFAETRYRHPLGKGERQVVI